MKNTGRVVSTVLLVLMWVWSPLGGISSVRADTPLTGTFTADDGSVYYVSDTDNGVYMAGLSIENLVPGTILDPTVVPTVWHRGLQVTTYFHGTKSSDGSQVSGSWYGLSRGLSLGSGALTFAVGTGSPLQLTTVSQTGGFAATLWQQTAAIDDSSPDILSRMDSVLKNASDQSLFNNNLSLHNSLKPYRDQTVLYGWVTARNFSSNEPPHVNYSPLDTRSRDYDTFTCTKAGDGDFDLRLDADTTRYETNFYSLGWGDRDPSVIKQKLTDSTAFGAEQLGPNQAYIGLEALMYGDTFGCGNSDSDPGTTYFPGWADSGGNSVLLNGRPIEGYFYQDHVQQHYDSGGNPDGLLVNNMPLVAGDYIRVTGALSLDCGHADVGDDEAFPPDFHTCEEGEPFSEDSDEQNQEIHPIYSIDILNTADGKSVLNSSHNLTGAWGGADGSTFYVRQIGNKVVWLGLGRDRTPLQPGDDYPPIFTYATVFEGTLSHNSDGSSTIQGSGVTSLPYGKNGAGSTYTATYTIPSGANEIQPTTCSILCNFGPLQTIDKLYEPQDTTAPASTLAIGTPQYSSNGQTYVTGATSFNLSATDDSGGSGVQNLWYRVVPQGAASPPDYVPGTGSSTSFNLSGLSDGSYRIDTYATDNAGNDEVVHSQTVYLDNTPPVITISQPTATNYSHSATITLNYTVDDGGGSGVAAITPTMDGKTTVNGLGLQSGQSISLLTNMSLGSHTFKVGAADNLGHASAPQSVTFTIIVTAQSIMDDVNQFVAAGAITQAEGTSLLSKLTSAAKARTAGNCANATTIYQSFISEVQAQTGKKITASAASILSADAAYLIAHCP